MELEVEALQRLEEPELDSVALYPCVDTYCDIYTCGFRTGPT